MVAPLRVIGDACRVALHESMTDLDSHADQCLLGNNTLVVHDYDKLVNVVGYDPRGPVTRSLHTISGALAYDCPDSGETYILLVHQAIHNPKLEHNLLSPFQMRLNDVIVNETPKFMTETPTEKDHAIVVTDPETNDELIIPLSVRGVTSTFPTRKPTIDEYNTCTKFTLTYDSPEYEPETERFADMERDASSTIDRLRKTGDQIHQTRRLCSVSQSLSNARQVLEHESQSNSILLDISPTLCDDTLTNEMQSAVHVSSVRITERRDGIDEATLARNFGIGLDTARRTLKATTQ